MNPGGSTPHPDCVSPPSPFRWWAAFLGVTLLALSLRLFAIDHDSLWYDEALTSRLIKVPILELITVARQDNRNPPLYWILGGAWYTLFGDSEAALRSFPALCGALTVPLLALVGRKLAGASVGLCGAFLLAISPTAIEISNEARPYSLAGLLAVAATWLFIRWVEAHRRVDLASYSIIVVLLFATHYYAAAVPLAHGVALVTLPRERRRVGAWLGAMAFAYLLATPVVYVFLAQLEILSNEPVMHDDWLMRFLATPMVYGFGRNLGWRDSPAWRLAALTAVALVGFWLPAGLALSRYRRHPFGVALLGSWFVTPILVPLAVALTLSPVYANRYSIVGLPPFLLLTAWGLEQCRPSTRRALLGLILSLTSLSLYSYATRHLKDDWRTETRFILERLRPGEAIAFDPEYEVDSFSYYHERSKAGPTALNILGSAAGRGGQLDDSISGIWLVRCAPREQPGGSSDDFAWNGLRLVQSRRSGRIEIKHFTRDTSSDPIGPAQPPR